MLKAPLTSCSHLPYMYQGVSEAELYSDLCVALRKNGLICLRFHAKAELTRRFFFREFSLLAFSEGIFIGQRLQHNYLKHYDLSQGGYREFGAHFLLFTAEIKIEQRF